MNFEVYSIPPFDKQLRRLVQKYPSLKAEFTKLVQSLRFKPSQGTPIGKHCYKIRLSISSKGKGKSGGARIITNIIVTAQTVYLLAIYDKSETLDLSKEELLQLLRHVPD